MVEASGPVRFQCALFTISWMKSKVPALVNARDFQTVGPSIHGDEPAGPLALLELFGESLLPRENDYWICPLLNPTGVVCGKRENHQGIDLNRDYSEARSEEIRAHVSWDEPLIETEAVEFVGECGADFVGDGGAVGPGLQIGGALELEFDTEDAFGGRGDEA